jgi:hypothetical protein
MIVTCRCPGRLRKRPSSKHRPPSNIRDLYRPRSASERRSDRSTLIDGRASPCPPRTAPSKWVKTNGSDEVLARAVNLLIGKAAFETAKRMYPRDVLEYRNGAQVIERSGEQ